MKRSGFVLAVMILLAVAVYVWSRVGLLQSINVFGSQPIDPAGVLNFGTGFFPDWGKE